MTRRLVAAALSLVLSMLVLLGIPFLRTVEKFERERLRLELIHDAVTIGATVEDDLSHGTPADLGVIEAISKYADQTGTRIVIVDSQGLVWTDSSDRLHLANAQSADPKPSSNSKNAKSKTTATIIPNQDITDSDAVNAKATNAGPASGARSMRDRPEFVEALKGNFAAVSRKSSTLGYASLFVAAPISSAGQILGASRVSIPTLGIDQRLAVQRTQLIGFGLAMAAFVTVLAFALSRWIGKPIAQLEAATRQFGAGNLATRAPTGKGPDDIRQLATEFNTMAERLDDLVNTQQAFVADASHELRSPLTAIRLQIEAMEYDTAEGIENRRQRALDEVGRLSRNVDGLLILARQAQPERRTTLVDLSQLTTDRARFWSSLMEERGLSLVLNIAANLYAHAGPDRFVTAFDNLISNALDAAPPGSTISVVAESVTNTIVVHIIDKGQGMSANQRVAAFDRFWRATNKRTSLGGSGLGLAIARKLVAVDHGTIRLDAANPQGIDAVLTYNRVPK
jgi:signal transduction histidine kinase